MSLISNIQKWLLSAVIFLFPIFFLPTTQEYYLTNKLYLLILGGLLILLLSAIRLIQTNSIKIRWSSYTPYILTFLLLVVASVIFSSPNKVQAILHNNFGLGLIASLTLLYFYCATLEVKPLAVLFYSAFVLSILSIIFFFNPFASFTLPDSLMFLKSQFFTPIGSQLDLAVFLGFFTISSFGALATAIKSGKEKLNPASLLFAFVIAVGCVFSLLSVYKQFNLTTNTQNVTRLELPPLHGSYLSSIETLKRPKTAIFGYGIDNFSTAFTVSKPSSYNNTVQWDRNFRFSRIGTLQIFTEAGIIAMFTFILIVATALITVYKSKRNIHADSQPVQHENDNPIIMTGLAFLCLIFLTMPISSTVLFLLFMTLSHVAKIQGDKTLKSFSFGEVRIAGALGALIVLLLVGAGFYVTARSYSSEYFFKTAVNYLSKNDGQNVYKYSRLAISQNPYIERYRINFAQLNLLIANNIAKSNKGKKIDEKQRATIAQAIQISIQEAKAVVTLNPQKSSNWENLGNIYRNIINIAQNASSWTISAYQRAIALDPNNPLLRLSLGGVYYSMGNYDEAVTFFTQAVALKPDFANFRFNLAWAYFQSKKVDKAVVEMQNVLSLMKDKNGEDYKKASENLEMFKKAIPKQTEASESGQLKQNAPIPSQSPLELPASPEAGIDPKIVLPTGVEPPSQPNEATGSAE